MAYNQLTLQERYYIEIEMKNGTSQNMIAGSLKRVSLFSLIVEMW
ncbi:MAG: hypothetical protein U9R27_03865 [Campylobacterota bacterium]|nr:hypothetical protein [Campylobacterota bacterium]